MMKRILWLSMAVLCALSLSARPRRAKNAQLFEVNGLHYQITDPALYEVEVTYTAGNSDNNYLGFTEVNIPAHVTYDGHEYTVTAIGQYAFNRCVTLEQVTIPATIRAINEYAFYSTHLESVVVTRGVETIALGAFGNCANLHHLVLPSTLLSMGNNVFLKSENIATITCYAEVPPAVSSFTFNAIKFASALLYVPAASIDAYRAAAQWMRFTNIQAVLEPEPDPTPHLWQPDESPIESADDAYPCPDAPYSYCGENLQWSLSADHTVLTITGTGAMYNYYSDRCVPWHDVRGQIQQVILPAGITYIGHHAFFGCVQLHTISSLDGVRVGTLAFGKCHRLMK